MKDTYLRQEKDRELFKTYLRGLKECNFRTMREAANWVCSQPASKFYISSKSLVNRITDFNRGIRNPNDSTPYNCKIKVLYDMYCLYLQDNPYTPLSCERICEELVEMPAPRFYIGVDSCLKSLHRSLYK